jgi:hypothetical protein
MRFISNRQARIFAWAVAIASMSALLAGVFAIYLSRDVFTSWYVEAIYPAGLAVALGFTPVGALIASRQPHNAFGWLMLTIGVDGSAAGVCQRQWALESDRPLKRHRGVIGKVYE